MKPQLHNSSIVVTDAAGTIGRSCAKGFAREGAFLVLGSSDAAALDAVVAQCEDAGAMVRRCLVDSTASASERLAREAITHFGRIDIWISAPESIGDHRHDQAAPEDGLAEADTIIAHVKQDLATATPWMREQRHGIVIAITRPSSTASDDSLSDDVTAHHGVERLVSRFHNDNRDMPRIAACAVEDQHAAMDTARTVISHARRGAGPAGTRRADREDLVTGTLYHPSSVPRLLAGAGIIIGLAAALITIRRART